MSRLRMFRGDSASIIVVVSGADLEATELRFTAKRSIADADADAAISKTSSGGGITVDADTATITLDPADTDDLPARPLVWDLQVTEGGTVVTTVAQGQLVIQADVSRAAP